MHTYFIPSNFLTLIIFAYFLSISRYFIFIFLFVFINSLFELFHLNNVSFNILISRFIDI